MCCCLGVLYVIPCIRPLWLLGDLKLFAVSCALITRGPDPSVWKPTIWQPSVTYGTWFLVNCRQRFIPSVTVDEQLVPFRWRCKFLQYMKNKPAKYGLKIFWVCVSRVPYAIDMIVYTGKQPGEEFQNMAQNIVQKLCSSFRSTGRNITRGPFHQCASCTTSLGEGPLYCVYSTTEQVRLPSCVEGFLVQRASQQSLDLVAAFPWSAMVEERNGCCAPKHNALQQSGGWK